jgi:hypothetical protein
MEAPAWIDLECEFHNWGDTLKKSSRTMTNCEPTYFSVTLSGFKIRRPQGGLLLMAGRSRPWASVAAGAAFCERDPDARLQLSMSRRRSSRSCEAIRCSCAYSGQPCFVRRSVSGLRTCQQPKRTLTTQWGFLRCGFGMTTKKPRRVRSLNFLENLIISLPSLERLPDTHTRLCLTCGPSGRL